MLRFLSLYKEINAQFRRTSAKNNIGIEVYFIIRNFLKILQKIFLMIKKKINLEMVEIVF